jgi:hypothetical protein
VQVVGARKLHRARTPHELPGRILTAIDNALLRLGGAPARFGALLTGRRVR